MINKKNKTKKHRSGFAIISNYLINFKELSWKAKGIYAYLYSKPDGWEFSGKRIKNDSTDGERSTYSGIKELEKAGFLKRNKKKDGRVEYEILLNSEKKPNRRNSNLLKQQFAKTASISNTDKNSNTENIDKLTEQSSDENKVPSNQIAELFDVFKKTINPTINFGNNTSRKAATELIQKYGFEKAIRTAKYAAESQGNKYCPTITTPYQLKEKIGELTVYWRRTQDKEIKTL